MKQELINLRFKILRWAIRRVYWLGRDHGLGHGEARAFIMRGLGEAFKAIDESPMWPLE